MRLAGTAFVGRAEELRLLVGALEQAAAGQGQTVLLAGEAGIGKTRLTREALGLARSCGFQLLEASAYPLEGGLAYALMLDAFGPHLRRLDASRQAALVTGLPDLGRLFSGLGLPHPTPLGDPALEKTRLFEAVARLLERLSHEAPLVVFLDDLHWADPASLELLHYLGRGLSALPVLLLGAYRPGELDGERRLRSLTRSLKRAGLGEEIALTRLGPDAVAALTQAVLGGDPPADLLNALEARAAGTPLFVEALIEAMIDSRQLTCVGQRWVLAPGAGVDLPPDARALMLERLERLEPAARRLADLMAVCGDSAPHEVLRLAAGRDEASLLNTLGRLRSTGLITEKLSGVEVCYTLFHPLMQEVAYAELSEMGRRRGHAALAAALEQLRPGDLERLARHYRGAGPEADQDRALEVLVAAGERARELHANDQAARHFGAALALVREGRRPELLPSLLERLGEAWERLGEGSATVAIWSEAVLVYQRRGDTEAMARLRRLLALTEWDRGRFAEAQAQLEAGLGALASSQPSPELAELRHAQVMLLSRLGDAAGVTRVAQELLALGELLQSPRVAAQAYLAVAHQNMDQRRFAAVSEADSLALDAAESAGEPLLVGRAHDFLALSAIARRATTVLAANTPSAAWR